MHITNKDLEFLINLEYKLGVMENWSDDVLYLWEMIERLQAQKEKTNKRTLEIITNKRKTDPTYGRSKKEIERIKRKER